MESRYLIYRLLYRHIDVSVPPRMGGKRVRGVVQRVSRDIFSNAIELDVGGSRHIFREPDMIVSNTGEEVCFVYGGDGTLDDGGDDEALFAEARESAYRGETVFQTIDRTQPSITSVMRFRLIGDEKKKKRRVRRAVG